MSSEDPCEICTDTRRDKHIICVVSETKDLIALERTREYKAKYHVLQGLISPLDGITPNDLRIKELLERIGKRKPRRSYSCIKSIRRRRSDKHVLEQINKTARD